MYKRSLIVVFICVTSSIAKEIPEYLHICKRNDPKVQSCFKESVLFLKPYLAKGIPELKIPSIEPFLLNDFLILNPTHGQNVGLQVSAHNINVFGCSNFDIKNLNIDFDTKIITLDILFKRLTIDGQYDINGRILLLPIKGTGKVLGNFTDGFGSVQMDCEITQKKGKEYIYVKGITMKITVGSGKIKLFNLFGGDSTFGEIINNVINENFDTLVLEFIPALEKELSKLFIKLSNRILSQFTYKQLFPES